jgi:SNF2 family DNA or RNA helicase
MVRFPGIPESHRGIGEEEPWVISSRNHILITYVSAASLAVSRLQAVISTFLLRRMKDSKLDGKRLIELPEKTVSLVKLQFSEEERDIYRMVTAASYLTRAKILKLSGLGRGWSPGQF